MHAKLLIIKRGNGYKIKPKLRSLNWDETCKYFIYLNNWLRSDMTQNIPLSRAIKHNHEINTQTIRTTYLISVNLAVCDNYCWPFTLQDAFMEIAPVDFNSVYSTCWTLFSEYSQLPKNFTNPVIMLHILPKIHIWELSTYVTEYAYLLCELSNDNN